MKLTTEMRDGTRKIEPKNSTGVLMITYLRLNFLLTVVAVHGTRKVVEKTAKDNSSCTKRHLAQQ